jgi:HD-like signal output (HDOD) protein
MSWVWILVVVAALVTTGCWWVVRQRPVQGRALTAADAPLQGARIAQASADGLAEVADGEAAPHAGGAVPLPAARGIFAALCARAHGHAEVVPGPERTAAQAEAEAEVVETLSRIRAHPRYVPRRPQLLPQLTRAINDPASNAQSIAAILTQDPALAGNLLRVANSVVYRRLGGPIEHLERAVTLLGTQGLRRTAMAALLQPVIPDDGSVFSRCASLLWDHTMLTSDLAVRAEAGPVRDEQHAAQLLALVCGLGAVVVVQVMRDCWNRRGADWPDQDTMVSLLEGWSVRSARAISADWGLSERVQRALAELEEGGPPGAAGPLVSALRTAQALAAARMAGGDMGAQDDAPARAED